MGRGRPEPIHDEYEDDYDVGCCCFGGGSSSYQKPIQVQPKHPTAGGGARRSTAVDGVPVDIAPPLRKISGDTVKNRPDYGEKEDNSASKIQALARGGRDRVEVRDKYRTTRGQESSHRPESIGLGPYAEEHPGMPHVADQLRFGVRDITARRVLKQIGMANEAMITSFEESAYNILKLKSDKKDLPAGLLKQMGCTRHYVDPMPDMAGGTTSAGASTSSTAGVVSQVSRRKQDVYLIGQFDCIAVPVRADFNVAFQPMTSGDPAKGAAAPVAAASVAHAAFESGIEAPLAAPAWPPHMEGGRDGGWGPTAAAADEAAWKHPGSAETNEVGASYSNTSDDAAGVPETNDISTTMLSGGSLAAEDAVLDCDGPDGFAGWFWVVHAAAPNIGESSNADDFAAYSHEEAPIATAQSTGHTPFGGGTYGTYTTYDIYGRPVSHSMGSQACWKAPRSRRRLDEDVYVNHMGRLWRNALIAMARLEVDDAVVFPFGMGAFLRHLGQNDDRYNDGQKLRKLRRRVADEFVEAVIAVCLTAEQQAAAVTAAEAAAAAGGKKNKKLKQPKPNKQRRGSANVKGPARVHLCLVVSDQNSEGVENHNSFLEAVAERARVIPQLKQVLLLRRNVDCLQLGHEISSAQWAVKGLPKVAVLNGASRKLVGNHWFQGGARNAIDENMHRRSASMARAAMLLNLRCEVVERRPLALVSHVVMWGGQVIRAADGAKVFVDKPASTSTPILPPKKTSSSSGSSWCGCCKRRPKTQPRSQAVSTASASTPSSASSGHKAPAGVGPAKGVDGVLVAPVGAAPLGAGMSVPADPRAAFHASIQDPSTHGAAPVKSSPRPVVLPPGPGSPSKVIRPGDMGTKKT